MRRSNAVVAVYVAIFASRLETEVSKFVFSVTSSRPLSFCMIILWNSCDQVEVKAFKDETGIHCAREGSWRRTGEVLLAAKPRKLSRSNWLGL